MRIKDKTKRKRNKKLKKHVLISPDNFFGRREGWWNVVMNPREYMKEGTEISR